MDSIYDPNDYTHLSDDSTMIQAAIDEGAKSGAAVKIPRFNKRTGQNIWIIERALRLYSGSVLMLENCHLRLADGVYSNIFINSNADSEAGYTKEGRQYDIRITGFGNALLDGGNHNGIFESDFYEYDENAKFVRRKVYKGLTGAGVNIALKFVNAQRITIENIRIINQRYWGMAFYYCSYGRISGIEFEALNKVPNQDGIDIRQGCNNFVIENISGCTGDDMVALTALGDYGDKFAFMNGNIYNVIIRNIRACMSGHCDIIRLLNRGGQKIYNIVIDTVLDCSDRGDNYRPLAAVRIGDLNDYPVSLAEPGDTFGITVRNVITRARFGVYAANTLSDSYFDHIQLYADAGIGMFFNGCLMKNISVNNLSYTDESSSPLSDIGYRHTYHKVHVDKLCAMIFNDCEADNINVQGLTAGRNLSSVFGGNSKLKLKAQSIHTLSPETKICDDDVTLADKIVGA